MQLLTDLLAALAPSLGHLAKTRIAPAAEVCLGYHKRQFTHAQDVLLALADRDGSAVVEQVEIMRGFEYLLVSWQRELDG